MGFYQCKTVEQFKKLSVDSKKEGIKTATTLDSLLPGIQAERRNT
jgi:hypothetical protein